MLNYFYKAYKLKARSNSLNPDIFLVVHRAVSRHLRSLENVQIRLPATQATLNSATRISHIRKALYPLGQLIHRTSNRLISIRASPVWIQKNCLCRTLEASQLLLIGFVRVLSMQWQVLEGGISKRTCYRSCVAWNCLFGSVCFQMLYVVEVFVV